MHGLRQEMRFSLFGRDLETAVRGILHVFRTVRSPFDEFVATPDKDGLELEVEAMSFEEYRQLVQSRFDAAAKVAQRVFYGRDNGDAPSPLVFPVLADLVNSLGLNYGQRCVCLLLRLFGCRHWNAFSLSDFRVSNCLGCGH